MKFSPEIVHESCHGKCREISGEISLLLVPQETKLENAQNFSRQISRRFSRDVLRLQMPNFMAFFILQTFVLDTSHRHPMQHLSCASVVVLLSATMKKALYMWHPELPDIKAKVVVVALVRFPIEIIKRIRPPKHDFCLLLPLAFQG